jgi:hypothetical protein
MSEGAISSDREQQARDNIASRRQSGLEPKPEDLRDVELADRHRKEKRARETAESGRS